MVRSILAVMLVGLLAVSASAFGGYDFLYTNDGAMTADAGAFGLKASFIYGMASGYFDFEGESEDYTHDTKYTTMWIPISLYYGVTDQIEIGVQPKFINDKDTWDPDARAEEEYKYSGIGDTWIYGKYMFMPEPMLTARLGVKVATGDDESDEDNGAVGDGQMDVDGALMVGMPAGPGQFDAALGYRFRMSKDETWYESRDRDSATVTWSPGSEIHFDAHYTYFLNDAMNLRFGLNGFFGSDDEYTSDVVPDEFLDAEAKDSAMNAVVLAPGFDYMMENGVGLGLDFFYPLMGQNIDAVWGLGLSVTWGM
jgi:hypothetical protein